MLRIYLFANVLEEEAFAENHQTPKGTLTALTDAGVFPPLHMCTLAKGYQCDLSAIILKMSAIAFT